MISMPLLKREIKSNYKMFLLFLAVLAIYISMIIYMFTPEMGKLIEGFKKMMPELMAMFGMGDMGADLIEFISSYLFGMILLIFPMIFSIILANKLIAKYVDRGSMAYLLATPNSRKKIAVTQALLVIVSVCMMFVFVALFGIICSEIMFPNKLAIGQYIILNVGAVCLHLFIAGLCYFISCICNETSKSNGICIAITVGFYLIQMLANMGGKLEKLKYLTIFSLFNTEKLLAGEAVAYIMIAVLFVAGIAFFIAGIVRFMKRDLPL